MRGIYILVKDRDFQIQTICEHRHHFTTMSIDFKGSLSQFEVFSPTSFAFKVK